MNNSKGIKDRKPLLDKRNSFEKLRYDNNVMNITKYGLQYQEEEPRKQTHRIQDGKLPKLTLHLSNLFWTGLHLWSMLINLEMKINTPTKVDHRPSHNTDIFKWSLTSKTTLGKGKNEYRTPNIKMQDDNDLTSSNGYGSLKYQQNEKLEPMNNNSRMPDVFVRWFLLTGLG